MLSHKPGHNNHRRHNSNSSHHGNHRHNSGFNHHSHHREDSFQSETVRDTLGNILDAALDEVNYQSERNRLTRSIESLKNQALVQDAQRNYGAAITLYDAALRDAASLNHIWARHQWHLGMRTGYAACSHHSQYTTELTALRAIVFSKQQAELQEAQRLRQIEEDKVREARRLREAEEARQREVQAAQDWQDKRKTIPYDELLKHAANAELEQAAGVLKDLMPLYTAYDRTRKHHNDEDREVLRQLYAQRTRLGGLIFQEQERLRLIREAADDNQRQEAIHHSMYHVLKELNTGDIPATLKALSDVADSSKKFHNIGNIQNQLRTPVSTFQDPLQELRNLQREFYNNAKHDASEFAKRITLLVQQDQNSPMPGKTVLYSSYELELENTIQKRFKANWKNFNSRAMPEDLLNAIAKQIVQRLKLIGNKRWMADVLTFTRWPNMSIDGYGALLLEVADLIDKYVPLNPSQLNKPSLDSLLRPYIEMQNSTQAVVAEHVDDIPKATYADHDQQSEEAGKSEHFLNPNRF